MSGIWIFLVVNHKLAVVCRCQSEAIHTVSTEGGGGKKTKPHGHLYFWGMNHTPQMEILTSGPKHLPDATDMVANTQAGEQTCHGRHCSKLSQKSTPSLTSVLWETSKSCSHENSGTSARIEGLSNASPIQSVVWLPWGMVISGGRQGFVWWWKQEEAEEAVKWTP